MRAISRVILVLASGLAAACGGGDGGPETDLPMELPFAYSRPDVGAPLSQAEIADFTAEITGLWRRVDYFTWLLETTHGVDASTGLPDYQIWWHDVDAVKTGDLVTFKNAARHGGSHNNAEPTSLALTQAIAGHLLTGDPVMGEAVEQLARSFTAVMEGFVHDPADPLHFLMSRNIVAQNHAFTLPSGKRKAVDYSEWFTTYEGWNANRVHYPDNPTWGDLYVTTMRSKDDLPWMYRATAWLPYVVELSPAPEVREAAAEALAHMQGFAQDIVDSGWLIRTKDAQGQPYVPDQDLATFVGYTLAFPDAECDARLATALVAGGTPLDQDCGSGQGSPYDLIACSGHYYNYSIVDGFHLNAVHLSLTRGQPAMARELLDGLVTRLERYQDPASGEPGQSDPSWGRDLSVLLLEAAALGLPLTSREAREVQRYLLGAVELYSAFPNWDLWDAGVPDGVYDFRSGFQPARVPEAVRVEELTLLLEYCWSPFRNPAGAALVDCAVVADPARWGEGR
ncbi:MAG TPA: hypothetical protein PK668_02865 [Myxococcota bacterium]|nr:hypothetical protein [Myxococcota bacterium]HRY94487.1 hypothetical protein [Myxococcota bacterium]HSA20065.1 hypothetical protein [Myxococcota bacterium]